MPVVKAVSVSERKGQKKVPVESIELVVEHGVAGDAHAGSGRQVSLLDFGSLEGMRLKLASISPGAFAENLTVEGLNALNLAVGDRVTVGGAVLEITQIGKTCHNGCDIRRIVGDCIMPREGLFARVLSPGRVRAGDVLERVS
ncbi:MOSC domain-containing protein [Fundidesulfovibrio agrisoli]|uniref:MOSC domain-containing protein n=1 Tax=Fundidesulfovibrio agrisoli TaxID=2922717 RepID=UPI001FABD8DB|nr:MOSC domain-containing protein [Fundidesulfovibrio agrisoli]